MSTVGSLDITLMRYLKHRTNYEMYARAVPSGAITAVTVTILDQYGKFFKLNHDAKVAMPDDVWAFIALNHKKIKPETAALIKATLANVVADVPNEVVDGIARRLAEARTALESGALLARYNEGEEVDLVEGLRQIAERCGPGGFDIPWVPENVGDMLLDDQDDRGVRWRLSCLNQSMRPLRSGDAGILAARVDTGKTTFVASEASFMGAQMEAYYGERRPILILVNEGPGKAVKQRVWQAALGITIPEMVDLQQAGKLQSAVFDALGGWESVKVLNVHDKPISYLEDLVRRLNPGMVWTDMLDNCPFDGTINNGGTRTDQILEAMYQRQRMWAVLYDTMTVATSQLSAEAAGELYPKMTQLANSKTGKPGAADYIVMAGTSNEEMYQNNRWISLPKNKLVRVGARKDPKEMVTFAGDRARYEDPINL